MPIHLGGSRIDSLKLGGQNIGDGYLGTVKVFGSEPLPSGYYAELLADSPVGLWKLAETSGTTAADSSGNGRNGTYVNSPTLGATGLLPSVADGTAHFDHNATQYVEVPHDAVYNFGGPYSLAAVVNIDANRDYNAVIGKTASGVPAPFDVWIGSGGQVQFFHYSGGQTLNTGTNSNLPAGTTHHLGFVWDGQDVFMYINGTLDRQVGYGPRTPGNYTTNPVRIGSRDDLVTKMDGRIQAAALFASAIPAQRWADYYAAR
jgi:hypothetical protein